MLNDLIKAVDINIINCCEIDGKVRRIDWLTCSGRRMCLFEDKLDILEEPIVLLSRIDDQGEDINLAAFCNVQFKDLVATVKGLSGLV